ncbi:MAG TPA: glycosyltransferase [Caulobacteraceae bacterium]|jgi:glycosyltransferase involved in cell wall biosynthesis|nr:glycosyltransferase [Caulobacteraceae bacterium]
MQRPGDSVDVSFVLPCLNEVQCLEPCIGMIREALAVLREKNGLTGEIIVADNGSTDGSQALAMRLGARVVAVSERGYGAALRGGFKAARGRYLVMGDADGSYDFREAPPMIEKLMAGAGLCMGSRFKGGIKPGAMPWKNRYIGNPVLTGILNVLFRPGISDAHCGLRALTRACFDRLGLTGAGMEFASEMVIKAALKGEVIVEAPATLSPDLRDRPPHLRPWRDGWRHLRYLFMLSPFWLFAVPALVIGLTGAAILAIAGWHFFFLPSAPVFFGDYWVVLAAAMVGLSHNAAILSAATHIHGAREGYRRPNPWTARLSGWVTLETMIVAGLAAFAAGFAILTVVLLAWQARHFGRATSIYPAVVGTLMITLGAQNILGGFLLAIINGNQAKFLDVEVTEVAAGAAARAST